MIIIKKETSLNIPVDEKWVRLFSGQQVAISSEQVIRHMSFKCLVDRLFTDNNEPVMKNKDQPHCLNYSHINVTLDATYSDRILYYIWLYTPLVYKLLSTISMVNYMYVYI